MMQSPLASTLFHKKLDIKPEDEKQFLLSFLWPDFIGRHRAAHIMRPISYMIQARTTDPVRSILWVMIKHKVQCVPVYNERTKKYVGLVDVLDIVHYISSQVGPALLMSDFFQAFKKHPCGERPIQDLVHLSRGEHWFTALETSPIDSILDITASGNVHRIPVIGPRLKLSGMVTKLGIVQFLSNNRKAFAPLSDQKISDIASLTSSTEAFHTVPGSSPTVDAFNTMHSKNVQTLGVTDAQGLLVDVVTAADVKGLILGDFFSDLRQPLIRFLAKSRIMLNLEVTPVFASTEDSVGQVLSKMAQAKATSMIVLNSAGRPDDRVINLRDILKAISAITRPVGPIAGGGSR